ncbi:aspartate aminotransferase family protein [Micromonospora sp. NPDC047074]|uniref:class-III pyridoxal-phosphate-dependent aminotransferase n=1 Tax=Micromonospora sp. NPDC047074 TaxID=3154339 RepID=UPI00340D6A96
MTDHGTPDGSAPAVRERDYLINVYQPKKYDDGSMSIVSADGCWVTTAGGHRMLDLHGQHMCLGVGHRHPRLVAALHQAVDGLDYAADFVAHEGKTRAAKLLIEQTMTTDWAGGVRFVSSGSEGTEMAMLIARLYTNRPIIVTRDLGFHGWTAAASAATGVASRRNVFTTESGEVRPVPSPHAPYPAAPAPLCGSCPLNQSYPNCKDADGTLACVTATERVFRSVGVEQIAGFITEIWHGAGAFLPPDEYVPQIRELTSRLGILWIDDESIGGPARTGHWWAFQHYGVNPDIVTMAKGLTSAAVPAGACVVSREISDFMDSGWWAHGSTFSGHPLACAAIVANLEIILDENLVERAGELGRFVEPRLQSMVERHPSVSGFTGRGLLWGIELVKDPATGERWVPADRRHNQAVDGPIEFSPGGFVAHECAMRGVLLFNYSPNTVTIAPPLLITEEELEIGLTAIDEALDQLDKQMP